MNQSWVKSVMQTPIQEALPFELRAVHEYSRNRKLGHLIFLVFMINFAFELVSGWMLFPFIAYAIYDLSYYRDVKRKREERIDDLQESDHTQNRELRKAKEGLNKLAINRKVTVALILLGTVYWGYDDYRQIATYQEEFASEALTLKGSGWCENFDVEIDANDGYVTRGIWPCIRIGNVQRAEFVKQRGIEFGCVTVSLDREIGLYGQNDYEKGYVTKRFCVKQETHGRYSTLDLTDKIYHFIDDDLEELNLDLCLEYRYSISEEDWLSFCSSA